MINVTVVSLEGIAEETRKVFNTLTALIYTAVSRDIIQANDFTN